MVNVNEFEQMVSEKFPEMTIEQILGLAEFGKAVLNVSDDLAGDLMYVTEMVLKSDESLVHEIQYCLSSLPALIRRIHEFNLKK